MTAEDTHKKLQMELSQGNYDFVDFGCSTGGSIELAQKLFGYGRGLGVDLDINKVYKSRAHGYHALQANLVDIPLPKKACRYVIMSHFLEHLYTADDARKAIRNGIAIAKEFVYIQQPYFDADGYLAQNGLKLYWSDWHGHRNHMTTLDFYKILIRFLDEGIISRFVIGGYQPIKRLSNVALHPIVAPKDQSIFDPDIHPKKSSGLLPLKVPVFCEIRVLIATTDHDITNEQIAAVGPLQVFFDSLHLKR